MYMQLPLAMLMLIDGIDLLSKFLFLFLLFFSLNYNSFLWHFDQNVGPNFVFQHCLNN